MVFRARRLMPAALLCCTFTVQASDVPTGDFWIIHHQGSLGTNQAFIADGDANNIYARPGGAKSLGVYQFNEAPGTPTFTAYDVEIDCAKNRARIMGAQDYRSVFNELRPAKFSSQWQTKPEAWLVQSRDFVCRPTERQAKKMQHLGAMPASQMAKAGPELFRALNREALKATIMQQIDEAFAQMPAK
ncbi:hypothetical protein F3J45_12360 [Pantoea sp. Ap-967]|uniref:hypothetical protein n=1 Tax=Pantoea sp. Ap-967 TaxID=2608362 RepID=UPI0014210C0D|nr:hypothetical protein [Pantoea sp. Ap-967]NIE75230.1 hypothetical protein [Pantoea sp. Ap-967]